MREIGNEIARNLTGYVLLLLGVAMLVCGLKFGVSPLVDDGRGLMDAALLALQVKRIADLAQPKAP